MSGRIKDPGRVRWQLKSMILLKYHSETEFARALGISRQALTNIIVGRNPGYPYRDRICKLLGFNEQFLFGDVREK